MEIEDIFVQQTERRQKKGSQLILELLNSCENSKLIFVFTKADNYVAQGFYQAVGFQKGGEMSDNWIYWQNYDVLKNNLFSKYGQKV